MCTHVHVRQSWTKRRKMKEERKKGYILETKGIPIRKEKRLGTKEGTNGELVRGNWPDSPTSRLLSSVQPFLGTARGTYSLQWLWIAGSYNFSYPSHPCSPRFPQRFPNHSLCTETPFDAKTVSKPVLLKFQSVGCKGPHGLFVGRTAGERHHWDKCPQCGQAWWHSSRNMKGIKVHGNITWNDWLLSGLFQLCTTVQPA